MIVSIAIIAYNEEKTLPSLLEDIVNQDYPHEKIELLLINSVSQDSTLEIMQRFAADRIDFKRIVVLTNENKTIPFGCNVALDNYTGDAFVRIDAHASVPSDFISKSVRLLESGEMVCGGKRPNIIDGENAWKQTLLTAEQSMFGSGIAPYRNGEQKMYVRTIFHGLYRREVYDVVGKYNELLTRNEDNDMSQRINAAGFKMCYDPDIVSYQHSRNSLGKMLRQKYLNGYWIGKTMGINPRCFSLFHFIPFAFVMGILLTTVLWCVGFPYLAWLMWGLYGLLIFGISLVEIFSRKFSVTNLLLPFLFVALHISYGVGTLVGLVEMPFWINKINK